MTDSHIIYNKNGHAVSFVGPDAVELYRVATLASSLKLYAKTGIIPTRGVTCKRMLEMASRYTGKSYKRGAALDAAADLDVWVKAMKAALPSSQEGA